MNLDFYLKFPPSFGEGYLEIQNYIITTDTTVSLEYV